MVLPAGKQVNAPLHYLVVVVCATLAVVPGSCGSSRVLTRHEVLAAQPAREMLNDGHWIIPHFGGVPRYQKPPATGWLIAASTALFGQHEWAARLPSGLATMALALVVMHMTTRLLGPHVGLLAGLIQATSVYVLIQGRLAEADIVLMLCTAIALSASVDASRHGNAVHAGRRIHAPAAAWQFCLATAMGFVFKGPIAIAYSAAGLAAFRVAGGRGAGNLFRYPVPIVLAFLIAAAWPVTAMLVDPHVLPAWYRETLGRAGGGMQHGGQPMTLQRYFAGLPAYVIDVPWLLLPWLPFAVAGVAKAWRGGELRRHAGHMLAAWFGGALLVLSLLAWRHKHYIFPVLPALSPPAALALYAWTRPMRHRRVVISGLVALTLAASAAFWMGVMPQFDGYRGSAGVGRSVADHVPPGVVVHLLSLDQHHVAWYTRTPFRRIDGEANVTAWLAAAPSVRYAIIPADLLDVVAVHGSATVLTTESPPPRRGRPIMLVRIDPAPATRPISSEPLHADERRPRRRRVPVFSIRGRVRPVGDWS